MTIRILGEGLDAVIFAYALTQRDLEFEWVVENNRFGGHFRGGLDCRGEPIDLGMVLLEPNNYGISQRQINAFSGENGQSARPFIDSAYQLLCKLAGDYQSVEIKSQGRDGQNTPDYFISDRFFAFEKNKKEVVGELKERVKWLEKNINWHPRLKLDQQSVLSKNSIAEAMVNIYGESFYAAYFKEYLKNFLGEKIHILPASSHRKAWVPLYWPETILEYFSLSKKTEPLFEPKFARFRTKSIAEWTSRMIETINLHSKKKIIEFAIRSNLEDLDLESESVYAFLDSSRLQDNSSSEKPIIHFTKLRIVHFCCFSQSAFVKFLADDQSGSFRLSVSPVDNLGSSKISIEFGQASEKLSDGELLESAIELCARLGIRIKCAGVIHEGKIPLHTQNSYSHSKIPFAVRNKQTLISASGTSLNDNIIRAAWAIDNEFRKEKPAWT